MLRGEIVLLCVFLFLVEISGSEEEFSDAVVNRIEPQTGSLWGETRITLTGTGFAENQFNYGAGSEHLGNVVVLASTTKSFPCRIHTDGCTEKQITCYTAKMPEEEYTVNVKVDGKKVRPENHCYGNNKCTFKPDSNHTPKLTSLKPTSGKTGEMMTYAGKIITDLYETNAVVGSNGQTSRFSRVYLGSHNCRLKNLETDQLFGIRLDSDTSQWGEFDCKQETSYVGFMNASFIISDDYGRAIPDLDMLHVSSTDKIYMYQSFASITGISPSTGSTNGGTKLTITGMNFDETDAPAKIMIAGTECTVKEEVTLTNIVCETAAQPVAASEYEGHRGLKFEMWDQTSVDLDQFHTLSTTADDYTASTIDSAHFEDATNDNFNARASGWFVAPQTTDYRFYIQGDDKVKLFLSTDESPSNKAEVASVSVKTNYFATSSQESDKVSLEKGKRYYLEILMKEASERAFFKIAARAYDTNYTSAMTGAAWQEKKKLKVSSTVVKDTQQVVLTIPSPQTKVSEKQTVMATGNDGTGFRLGLFGVYTVTLYTGSSADDVADALSQLPVLDGDTITAVSADVSQGTEYTITFDSDRGDIPDLTYKWVNPEITDVTITVSEQTKGKSSLTSFSLSMDNLPSPAIPTDAGKEEVKNALFALFGVRCPTAITNPTPKAYSEDFEGGVWSKYGTPVSDETPFCGRFSSHNPEYLFKKSGDEDKRGVNLLEKKMLCFAYYGSKSYLKMKFTYRDDEDEKKTAYTNFFHTVDDETPPTSWTYQCIDMYEVATTSKSGQTDYLLEYIKIYRLHDADDLYVDSVNIVREATTDDMAGIDDRRMPQVKPNNAFVRDLEVNKDGNGRYTIAIDPHDCGYQFPLFAAGFAVKTAGETDHTSSSSTFRIINNDNHLDVAITRTTSATPPVGGFLKIGFKGVETPDIPADAEEEDVQNQLQLLGNMGNMKVVRTGDCANFEHSLTWLSLGGDQEEVTVVSSSLTGNEVTLDVITEQNGSLWYDPIQGDMLRTIHDEPQVSVMINNVPSACEGDCTYEWTAAATPQVTGATTGGTRRKKRATISGSKAQGTVITISGTGFSPIPENNIVEIGGYLCAVTTATTTTITCSVANGPVGTHDITVNVVGSGTSTSTQTFTYETAITGISPTTGGSAGGTLLTITGYGFGPSLQAQVGGQQCQIVGSDTEEIRCYTPQAVSSSTTNVPVTVTQGGETSTSPTDFTYNYASTPQITQISSTSSSVSGGTEFTITGTNFGSVAGVLTLCGKVAELTTGSYSDTSASFTFPQNPPGDCSVRLQVGNIGIADTSSISVVTYTLKVTNIFPTRGSVFGGTEVTISGEGFKDTANIKFGTHACDIKSATTTRIVCIIADTGKTFKVQNTGSDPEYGAGYGWEPVSKFIQSGDSIQFVWRTPEEVTGIKYGITEVASATTNEPKAGGFQSAGPQTPNGAHTQYFPNAGTYYYTSGFIDEQQKISARGKVIVVDKSSFSELFSLTIDGFEAVYDTSGSDPADVPACPGTTDPISGCSDPEPADTDSSRFNFHFWTCSTPKILDVSQKQGSTVDVITITGEGFTATKCQNEINIGGAVGIVDETSTSQIKLHIDESGSPPVGRLDGVSVRVGNRGYPKNGKKFKFTLLPLVTAMSPTTGSKAGGTRVTLTGTGFIEDETSVDMEGFQCNIVEITYTQVICATGGTTTGAKTVSVTVEVGDNLMTAEWQVDKVYTYDKTPTVTSATPNTVSGASSSITISGTDFGTSKTDVTVKIADSICDVTAVTDTSIQCDVGVVSVGTHDVYVNIAGLGKADPTVDVQSSAVISGISPIKGSLHGDLTLNINGNGFVDGDTKVTIDGKGCNIVSVTASQIKCTTPDHAAGDVDVVVVSNDVTYDATTFTYAADVTPTLTSLTPNSGIEGDSITANGAGFSTTASDNVLAFESNDAKYVSKSPTDTTAMFTLENQPTNEYLVRVIVAGKGATESKTFTYQVGITSITKSTGGVGGEQRVSITGQGFVTENTTVTICDQTCTFVDAAEQSASTYICLTPPPDTAVTTTKTCDVTVTVNGLSETLANGYTYDASITPEVTDVNPRRGGTGGGTVVTITGSGFGTTADDVKVSIGGTDCPVTAPVTDTQITCTTEASTSQRTMVKVEVLGNGVSTTDAASSADYWYIDVWSSSFTWGGKDPPAAGDFVVVPKGQILLLDVDTPILKMVLIQGGELIFDEKDIELNAENILIVDQGKLQVGTEEKPFEHKGIITMHGHLRSIELPIYGAKTLAVREGTLDLHGKPQTVMWTHLGSTAAAGSTTITLKKAVDWSAGDQIVIATTGDKHSQKESEVRTITEVSADKMTLTVAEALVYEHLGVTLTVTVEGSNVDLEARAEVGLLTHNVVVRGSDDTKWHDIIDACEDGFDTGEFAVQTCFQGRFGDELGSDQFGLQIMFHAAEPDKHLATGRLSHVEVTYAGQAFRLGRYPIHFHLNGDMSDSYVRGCSIHKTFNRAVNVHGTHNMFVEHNVIYNIMGGAFFLEDGIETGNTFQYNLAVFVKASTSLLNDDITPAAFWVTNPDNIIQHNAAAGGTHFGYWYRMHTHPDGPSKTTTVRCQEVSLGKFSNNSAHSLGWFGLWIFEEYRPSEKVATFESLTAWHNTKGAESVITGNVQFKDFLMVANHEAGIEFKKVKDVEYYSDTAGPGIFGGAIVSYLPGLTSNVKTKFAISNPFGDGFKIKDVKFANFDQANSAVMRGSVMAGTCVDLCGGFTYHVSGLKYENCPNLVRFAWPEQAVYIDLDGSFTGSGSGSSVIPTTGILPSGCTAAPAAFNIGVDSSICPPSITFHRFAFNSPLPKSLLGKAVSFTNSEGSTTSPFAFKRVTHKDGWMVILVDGYSYKMVFEDAAHLTNISYNGALNTFTESTDHVIIRQESGRPDKFFMGSEFIAMSDRALDNSLDYNGYWYYDDSAGEISYLVSQRTAPGATPTDSEDRAIKVNSFKCFFDGCKAPPDVKEIMERPDPYHLWSSTDSWENNIKPMENDEVIIPENRWIVADEAIPRLKSLIIHGGLEFDNDATKSFHLSADWVIVYGRLVIGWPDEPFLGLATIHLTGSHDSIPYIAQDGPNPGAKALVVYGAADLNGKDPGVTWTSLASTATKGSNTLTLSESVTWAPNDEILVTTTSYSAWHTETFKITAVTNGNTLTVNDTLKHTHSVVTENFGNGRMYSVSAKVGLLTRNIKIVGGNDDTILHTQSFGARVLVAATTFDETTRYSGEARIKNVEFYHTGQEGYTSEYDPRYSVAFVGVLPNSKVVKCSFHNGFSPAIGVYSTKDMLISDNVVHHTVGSGIIIASEKTNVLRNLVTLTIFPGTYQDREESKNIWWVSGIDGRKATDIVITDNVVAGSERAGIRVIGEECSGESAWSGNEVHSSLIGVPVFDSEDTLISESCVRFSNFLLWRNFDFGIYYNYGASVEVVNLVSIENGLGFFPLVIGPSAVAHQTSEQYVNVKDSIFVGETSEFDCDVHKLDKTDDNFRFSSQARGFVRQENVDKVGTSFATFTQGGNNSPEKPFTSVMSYNALSGRMNIEDVVFANFGPSCASSGRNNYAITTNKDNDDLQHPITSSKLDFRNTDLKNRYFNHRPNIGKINPSDCVDMDCDALKKTLLVDSDGTLLGSPGSIIPESEWQWDGDRRRGLGDYRIPTVMLTEPDGTRIPVENIAPNKGIVGNRDCVFKADWNAYECHNIEYHMMIIENMDEDTELRRLSPVAILINKYVDLINGPQDHGWCAGYTCQKRLSTFHALVENLNTVKVFFTSTSPQTTRFMLLNVDNTKAVLAAEYFAQRYRLDVYVNGKFILPRNGEWQGTKFIYKDMPVESCIPNPSTDLHGANCMDQENGLMYFVLKGSAAVEIRTTKQVVVGLKFMTVEEFFGEEIVDNLAKFLGVDPIKIRIVKIVRETPVARRRKRDAVVVTEIVVECGDTPSSTGGNAMTQDELEAAAAAISNGVLLGHIPIGPEGINPDTVTLLEPLPDVSSEAWGYVEPDTQPYTLSKAGRMTFYEAAVPGREGQEFPTPIRLRVYDEEGSPIMNVGTTANPWRVEATLKKGSGSHSSAVLGGSTVVNFAGGWANFTDLHISHIGEDYIIEFNVVYPESDFKEETPSLTILKRDLDVLMVNKTTVLLEDAPMTLKLGLRDRNTGMAVSDINWRGHTWSVTASTSEGTLSGTKTISFDDSTGHATFTDLQLDEVGRYYVNFTVVSTPLDYAFIHEMYLDITNQALEDAAKEKTSTCQFKFDTDYHENRSPRDVARFARKFAIESKGKFVKVVDSTAAPGSVLATLIITGSTSGVNDVVGEMCKEVEQSKKYEFNGQSVPLEHYMMVDGRNAYGVTCGPRHGEKPDLHPGIIAAIVIASVLVIVLIVIVLVWRFVIVPKTKTYDSNRDLRSIGRGDGKYSIEDYLFRDKSYNSMKTQAPHQAAPVDTTGTTFSLSVNSRLDLYDDRPSSTASGRSLPPKMPLPSD